MPWKSSSISSGSHYVQNKLGVESQNFILYEATDNNSSNVDDSVHETSENESNFDFCCNDESSSHVNESYDSSDDCICLNESEENMSIVSASSSETDNIIFCNENITITAQTFGSLQYGEISKEVLLYEMINQNKMSVQILTYGARFHKICVPDKHGNVVNVILNGESLEEYLENNNLYLNATIGRTIGIIKNSKFCLNKESFYLSQNFKEKHHLNGGKMGLDQHIWDTYVDTNGDVLMTCVTKDGDDGYPGTVLVQARFCLNKNNELRVTYTARTTLPCPCNISNRIYFNLAGTSWNEQEKNDDNKIKSLYDHFLNINAPFYSINNEDGTHNKQIHDVTNTEYDLRIPTQLGIAMACHPDKGFDCLFKLLSDKTEEQNKLKFVSRVIEPISGRVLELYTTENFVWFSTCNDLHEPNDSPIIPDYDLNFLGLSVFQKKNVNIEESNENSPKESSGTLADITDELPKPENSNTDSKNIQISSKTKSLIEKHSELTVHDSNQTLQEFTDCLDKELSEPSINNGLSKKKILKHTAFFFQPQNFPNAINHQKTYNDIILMPGKTYKSEILLKFGINRGKILTREGKPKVQKLNPCCGSSCPRRFLSRCCDYCDENCTKTVNN